MQAARLGGEARRWARQTATPAAAGPLAHPAQSAPAAPAARVTVQNTTWNHQHRLIAAAAAQYGVRLFWAKRMAKRRRALRTG